VAGRNSCRGPWTPGLDLQLNYKPDRFGLKRRLTVSTLFVNPLVGLDQALHGGNNLRGWGQFAQPDPTLLAVRGFDPTNRRYTYEVNQRFGNTRQAAQAFRQTFQVGFQVRYVFGQNPFGGFGGPGGGGGGGRRPGPDLPRRRRRCRGRGGRRTGSGRPSTSAARASTRWRRSRAARLARPRLGAGRAAGAGARLARRQEPSASRVAAGADPAAGEQPRPGARVLAGHPPAPRPRRARCLDETLKECRPSSRPSSSGRRWPPT
jgi:hypothetical protein